MLTAFFFRIKFFVFILWMLGSKMPRKCLLNKDSDTRYRHFWSSMVGHFSSMELMSYSNLDRDRESRSIWVSDRPIYLGTLHKNKPDRDRDSTQIGPLQIETYVHQKCLYLEIIWPTLFLVAIPLYYSKFEKTTSELVIRTTQCLPRPPKMSVSKTNV